MKSYKWIYFCRQQILCALLCTGYWMLPALSFALNIAPSYPPIFIEQANMPTTFHLVLRQNAEQLQLWTQEGELLTSQTQVQKVIINHPHIKSLTLDFRSGQFDTPVVYYGNRQQDAQLIIQGGEFPLLNHTLQDYRKGYLDLNHNGQIDVEYNNVAEVHLLVEADSEVRIETPEPFAPTRMQRVSNPPMYRVSSKEDAFPTTVVPAGRTITLFSPSLI